MNFDSQSCVPAKQLSLFSIDMLTWKKLVKNQVVSLSRTESHGRKKILYQINYSYRATQD